MQRITFIWLAIVVLAGPAAGAESAFVNVVTDGSAPPAGVVTVAPESPPLAPGPTFYPATATPACPVAGRTIDPACTGCGGMAGRPLVNGWHCFKARMQWSHWGYAEEFVGVPLGASVRCHQQSQIANGLAARFVLHRYDFGDESGPDAARLNGRGAKRLNDLLAELQAGPQPSLVIERSPGKPQLDAARVECVTQQLRQAHLSLPVVASDPLVPGLRGDDAKVLAESLLEQIQQGGSMTLGSTSNYLPQRFAPKGNKE